MVAADLAAVTSGRTLEATATTHTSVTVDMVVEAAVMVGAALAAAAVVMEVRHHLVCYNIDSALGCNLNTPPPIEHIECRICCLPFSFNCWIQSRLIDQLWSGSDDAPAGGAYGGAAYAGGGGAYGSQSAWD